ncbi:DUF1553 domain-containing protein [Fimbriiglobus ruber]|uniref:DUF1549 domain-containing protein n=1 Tax=Fimbriiglobus ruber TaxID=1908690 RepID=A0A225D236_9BACT|nr:DUF1553 domain-containing protein [Fimbriiglobus ruber]OWK35641.1 hypothetical protein FRUB_08204 [Fimbriiglobus ruber]
MARLFSVPLTVTAVAVVAFAAAPALAVPPGPDPAATAAAVDKQLAAENAAGPKTQSADAVGDLAFLRRLTVDLTGRIPTEAEMQKYLAWPAADRRTKAVEEFMGRDQFADRWAVFFGDVLRVRYTIDGGAAYQAFIHEAVRSNMPYDQLARKLIAASGRAGSQPETGFVLGDEADPMALTGVISQVFMGVRISCAQCHDHPFDSWTRQEFYDLAAFFGKTRRVEHRVKMQILGVFLNETQQTSIMWPPEDKAKGKTRKEVKAEFPFKLDEGDGPNKHLARLTALRKARDAEAKAKIAKAGTSVDDLLDGATTKGGKKDELDVTTEAKAAVRKIDLEGDLYRASDLRRRLAEHVTNPRNRFFSRAIVNRTWAELVGRGFVNPVDDFRADNPPSHPKTLDYLADEFVASGYDFRFLVKTIVNTAAYRRGHLPGTVPVPERMAAEKAFTAAPVRRMVSEALFDSIVLAGHLFEPKHRPGDNMTTVVNYVQVAAGVKEDPTKPGAMKGPEMMAAKPAMAGGGYDLEKGIEVDFKNALKKKDDLEVDKMSAKSSEELEAEMMMKNGSMKGKRVRYVTKEVKTLVDDNPKFNSSLRMAAPAPVGHFLRVFGQTDRVALDERRDHSPSMRQALMMLNGKLSNEAARVGPLEPLYPLVAGEKADLDAAIKLVYREALTREPSPDEVTDAKAVVKDAATPLDGIADLRWALFNSNEFRFIP